MILPPTPTRARLRAKILKFLVWSIILLIFEFLVVAPLRILADPVTADSNVSNYLFSEDFEGPGFENTGWFKTGTPDEDYTTTPLHGAQSLHCLGGQYIYRSIEFSNSFYMYLMARWNTWGDYNNIIYWDNAGYGFVADLYANHNFFQIAHGSAFTSGTARITTNTTYHIWYEWTLGTGSNGTVNLFVSTNGIKPALPDASVTNGTGLATERMYLGPTGPGPDVIFDQVLIAESPIGNMTEGNQPPSISNIPDQTITENSSTGPISFTVSDAETNAESLVVTGSSSNPTLLPDSNLIFGGSGSNRTVTATPAANQFGSATVTVRVSDASLSTSAAFNLTVKPMTNSPPVISDIPDQTTAEDNSTGPISFTVGDAESPASSLIVSGTSSNPGLVPNGNIVFGGSGSNRTVTLMPATNQSGSATITVTVSDGALSSNDTFVLTVTPVNDAPTISNIPD